jgi:peroxiredoxin
MFLLAGSTKLVDPGKFRQSLIEFGVPGRPAAPLGFLLPLAELAIAASFLSTRTAWWAAIGAAILLTTFSLGIAANLLLGRRPECNCFGQLSSSPIGWPTAARNMAMAAVAGWLVWAGHGVRFSMLDWQIPDEASWPLASAAIGATLLAVIGWLFVHLAKQNGRLLLRIEALESQMAIMGHPVELQAATKSGLGVGATAPSFQLSGLYGEILTLKALQAQGKLLLLIFSDPDCGPCGALMPQIGKWQHEFSATLNIVVISRGSIEANRAKAEDQNVTQILLQKDRETAEAYSCSGTPGALLVRPDGFIASPLAMGPDAITALVNRTIGGQRLIAAVPDGRSPPTQFLAKPPLKIGEKPPRLGLSDLNGQSIDFGNSEGSATLLLFWNPACGFCDAMLEELRTWEANRRPDAPRLLLVSAGASEENAAMGLRSQIALDQNFSVGQLFGATGTPSAVLLDSEAAVASDVAAGASNVMALATRNAVRSA